MEKPNILLVDDDKDFVEAIKIALDNRGFEVVTAFDGEEALLKAKKLKPDLIILDVMLPKKDGYSVCHDLKSDDTTSHIPILMLTSLGKKRCGKGGAEIMAKGHKAEGYLEKPVEPQLLAKRAMGLIQKAEEAEEKKLKVLFIDDDPDFIAAVKTILEENDYSVATSHTGEDGILSAVSEKPDLILLDVMLPEKDGYAVCKELKEDNKTKSIPIVMLTSVGQKLTKPDFAKAIAVTHRADDYLEKPVDSKELLKRIRKLIGPTRRLV